MATQQQGNGGQARPITSHPLFPAVVALWFGALFGIGSLVLRSALIEELVIASRIDLLVPAAAPPLGLTARLLLALGLAAFGAMLGAWIGRKLGEAAPAKSAHRRDTACAGPRDIPREDLAEPDPVQSAPSADAEALPVRRRTLAPEGAETARDVGQPAPVAPVAPQIFVVAETGIAPIDSASLAPEPPESPELPADAMPCEQPAGTTPVAQAAAPAAIAEPAADHVETLSPSTESELDEPIAVPMLGLALPQAAPLFAARAAPVAAAMASPPPRPAAVAPDAPLQDLAARLASAMERRRMARRSGLVPPPAPQTASPGGDLTPASPPSPPAPMALPAAMRPLLPEAFADDADTLAPLEDLLPPRQLSVPPVSPFAAVEADDTDDSDDHPSETEDRFSSLLALAPRGEALRAPTGGIGQGPIPDEIEPVVVFPGQLARSLPAQPLSRIAGEGSFDPPQHAGARITPPEAEAPRDQDETERALRQALASLQRMSGTA